MAEPLPYEGLSSRKLVLETAYFNVLTAYEPEETTDILSRFPNVDAVIIHSELYRNRLPETIAAVKKISDVPVFVVATGQNVTTTGADEVISSHAPQDLLNLLTGRFAGERAEKARADSKLVRRSA